MTDMKKITKEIQSLGSYKFRLNKVKKMIKNSGLDWYQESEDGCTLFEEAVYAGLEESVLKDLFSLFLELGMNINYQSSMYGDTYMHTLIEADDYDGLLTPFLYIGYQNDFDSTLKNKNGKTIWDCLKNPDTTKQLSPKDVKLCLEMKSLFEQKTILKQLKNIEEEKNELQQKKEQVLKQMDEKYRDLCEKQKRYERKLGLDDPIRQEQKIKQKIEDLYAEGTRR